MNLIINNMKDALKATFIVLTCISIGVLSYWLYWEFYIKQLTTPLPNIVGDPLYIMSIIFGVSLAMGGCAVFASLMIIYEWKIQRKITLRLDQSRTFTLAFIKKFLLTMALLGGGFAFVSNIILLHKIIPENGYVLCPKKIGYKKNLMRDYVLDVSQCER